MYTTRTDAPRAIGSYGHEDGCVDCVRDPLRLNVLAAQKQVPLSVCIKRELCARMRCIYIHTIRYILVCPASMYTCY